MTCPYCGRLLFLSALAWEPCPSETALLSVRCTRKARCGQIVYLRLVDPARVRFEHEETRRATLARLHSLVPAGD